MVMKAFGIDYSGFFTDIYTGERYRIVNDNNKGLMFLINEVGEKISDPFFAVQDDIEVKFENGRVMKMKCNDLIFLRAGFIPIEIKNNFQKEFVNL